MTSAGISLAVHSRRLMNHLADNIRPLICPQFHRVRHRSGIADVIHLKAQRHRRIWRRSAGSLAILAVLVAFAIVMARSSRNLLGGLLPGWPWW